jgi:hypothetical protein
MDCLKQAVTNGLSQKNWFRHDGDLDSIWGLPHFQKWMALRED